MSCRSWHMITLGSTVNVGLVRHDVSDTNGSDFKWRRPPSSRGFCMRVRYEGKSMRFVVEKDGVLVRCVFALVWRLPGLARWSGLVESQNTAGGVVVAGPYVNESGAYARRAWPHPRAWGRVRERDGERIVLGGVEP